MTWTKERLQSEYNLGSDDVVRTLRVCQLSPDKDEYTDEEISSKFMAVRNYFNEERTDTYTGAADLFQQEFGGNQSGSKQPEAEQTPKMSKARNGLKPSNPKDISDLLALASKQTGTRISLTEAAKIMAVCSLSDDQEEYTQAECDRFKEACNLLKKQGKTYDELAAHFGVGAEGTDTNISSDIDETAAALDQSGNGVVSEVMRHKAKVDASAAASLYLRHLANEFGSAEFQQAWNQMEEALKAKVVGKSHLRTRQMLGEIRAIPPSRSPLNALPEISDNGSTTD